MSGAATADHTLLDRELSWVEFNRRVLDQALRPQVPLLERLRFLTIVSSNFDEFFMVRVAALKRGIPATAGARQRLARLAAAAHGVVEQQYRTLRAEVLPQLQAAGVRIVPAAALSPEQRRVAADDFRYLIFPALAATRLAGGAAAVASLRLHLAFRLQPRAPAGAAASDSPAPAPHPGSAGPAIGQPASGREQEPLVSLVAVPSGLDRLRPIPGGRGEECFLLLEESIVLHASQLFPGYQVADYVRFRVTRDADLEVDEATDEDFIEALAAVLVERRSSAFVRLEVDSPSAAMSAFLTARLGLAEEDVYAVSPLDLTGLKALSDLPRAELRYPLWRPLPAPALADAVPWEVLRQRDVLLHHPYETFDHVLGLLQAAAEDEAVLAIKMTLYRTSGDSPVVRALERAAANGKQVTVLVELKARFDEQQNIDWATRLERAGAIVVYGIARLKVHAKALLIVRREAGGVRTYLHLGTGNYNDTTARLYTDLGLLTAREELAHEATLFFNTITGYSSGTRFQLLAMAPTTLKRTILAAIEREAAGAAGGLIMAKMNSLSDEEVIAALYAASRAGVTVLLNVRGVCLLRPRVAGLSDNIRVVSIVDRFLEHSRIVYFRNGGAEQVYLASADWMPRNLERRVELMFPVEQPDLRRRLVRILELYFADNCHSYELQADGHYRPRRPERRRAVRAQEALQRRARAAEQRRVGPQAREFTVRRRPPA